MLHTPIKARRIVEFELINPIIFIKMTTHLTEKDSYDDHNAIVYPYETEHGQVDLLMHLLV